MADGAYIFSDKTTANTAIALVGFVEAVEGDVINFVHENGFGKFWGDEWANPIGCPLTENPLDPQGDWIYPEGEGAVYFHCRMPNESLPPELDEYLVTNPSRIYETYGESLLIGNDNG